MIAAWLVAKVPAIPDTDLTPGGRYFQKEVRDTGWLSVMRVRIVNQKLVGSMPCKQYLTEAKFYISDPPPGIEGTGAARMIFAGDDMPRQTASTLHLPCIYPASTLHLPFGPTVPVRISDAVEVAHWARRTVRSITSPATTSMVDRLPKSSSSAARPDGCACRDSRALASNPCSACTVPVHGSALTSVAARCRASRSGACRAWGLSDIDNFAAQAMQRVLTDLAHGKIDFAAKGVG
jgi:hypothetical protein